MDATESARRLGTQNLPKILEALATFREHVVGWPPRCLTEADPAIDALCLALGHDTCGYESRRRLRRPTAILDADLRTSIKAALLDVWNEKEPATAEDRLRLLAAIDTAIESIDADGGNRKTRSDKNSDKANKKRLMDVAAMDCARRYKEARSTSDPTATIQGIVEDYAIEMKGKGKIVSVGTTLKRLTDNPEYWKS